MTRASEDLGEAVACTACEGRPVFPNIPCAVCGAHPAPSPAGREELRQRVAEIVEAAIERHVPTQSIRHTLDDADAILALGSRPVVPTVDRVCVPREPTEAMIEAANACDRDFREEGFNASPPEACWSAMLAAHETGPQGDDWLALADAPLEITGPVWSPDLPDRLDFQGRVAEYSDGERTVFSNNTQGVRFTHWRHFARPPAHAEEKA